MIKQWVSWINLSLIGVSLLFFLAGTGFLLMRPREIPVKEFAPERTTLPKGAFSLKKEEYDAIGPPFMTLRYAPMSLQLPDLRSYLVYYGRNERPDVQPSESLLHFSFMGSKDPVSIQPGKPLFLVYDKDQPRIKYRFSPGNEQTSLWIEAVPGEKEATVNVAMRNEAGEIIRMPDQFAQFKLQEKEFGRFGAAKWEIGKFRVDGTLLARQRARWYGQDLFLVKHGGEEYKELAGKQRIDFGEGADRYSVYVDVGDALAWKDDKWAQIEPGLLSQKYPLLVLSKIDERLMRLDLWDIEGKGKMPLNMIKSNEPPVPVNILQNFKFVGARTRSQLMFEIKGERIIIGPKDWLLLQDGKWMPLGTEKAIDDYVDRRITGPLFIVDEVKKEEGKQILFGTLFNATRTEMTPVVMALQQGGAAAPVQGETPEKGNALPETIEEEGGETGAGAKREALRDLDRISEHHRQLQKQM